MSIDSRYGVKKATVPIAYLLDMIFLGTKEFPPDAELVSLDDNGEGGLIFTVRSTMFHRRKDGDEIPELILTWRSEFEWEKETGPEFQDRRDLALLAALERLRRRETRVEADAEALRLVASGQVKNLVEVREAEPIDSATSAAAQAGGRGRVTRAPKD